MQRKVMIFGSGGQLGVELCGEFGRRGFDVRPFNRQSLDVTDSLRVEEVISQASPDVVINSAAYNQVDIAEKEPLAAYQANALAIRNLAMACRQSGAKLVHYSTDYVFDGTKGSAYIETDQPHPLGAYGVSKLAGELYAQAYLSDALIIRTSGVFGPGGLFTPRGNFLEIMLRLGKGSEPIKVVEDHFASPTYAPAMAAITADMVEAQAQGVFHLGGGEAISWYAFAAMIFELAGLSPVLQPSNEREYRTAARRPKFSALSNAKLEQAGFKHMPSLRLAVAEYLTARERIIALRSA